MGTCCLFIKSKLKKPLIVFVVLILIFTTGLSCTTTDDEYEQGLLEEEKEEDITEEVTEAFYYGTYQEQKHPELRISYIESTELLPEDMQIPQEVHIDKWNLARLIIPKIEVDLIVLGGVDVFDLGYLDKAPVHFGKSLEQNPDYKGSLPNTESGNVAIGGHRHMQWNYFLDIDLLEEGDEIILDIDGYRFIYHVQWQKIVDKFDWSCLEPTDYPALTLMSCEPDDDLDPDPDHRLFVRAELYEVTRTPDLD